MPEQAETDIATFAGLVRDLQAAKMLESLSPIISELFMSQGSYDCWWAMLSFMADEAENDHDNVEYDYDENQDSDFHSEEAVDEDDEDFDNVWD